MSDLLLERAAELAAIDRAIRVARAGHGRHVVIAGPPGTGRTALLERARARAADQGMTVLEAGGEAGEREFPLAVARRLLAPGERYDALLELHARLAAAAPVLVTVDDLHSPTTRRSTGSRSSRAGSAGAASRWWPASTWAKRG